LSEDPDITEFVPHVASTAQQPEPYVWAVDGDQAPAYWFPRNCPRATAWVTETTTPEDQHCILGPGGGRRVHAIEYPWLAAMSTTTVYAYRLPREPFRPIGEPRPYAWVASEPVRPLAPPEPLGDLIHLHERDGIQLRVLPRLGDFWAAVVASTLDYSGVRLANSGTAP
jgi:hypothetical protein